jgi:hypothetical protein
VLGYPLEIVHDVGVRPGQVMGDPRCRISAASMAVGVKILIARLTLSRLAVARDESAGGPIGESSANRCSPDHYLPKIALMALSISVNSLGAIDAPPVASRPESVPPSAINAFLASSVRCARTHVGCGDGNVGRASLIVPDPERAGTVLAGSDALCSEAVM